MFDRKSPRATRRRVATFVAWHVLALLGALLVPPTRPLVVLALGVYLVGMFGVTAGYHRYFAHRSFRTSRGAQLLFAVLAEASLQKGVLWWAAHHRTHHRLSDRDGDPHSPVRSGLLHAHMGWVLTPDSLDRDDSVIPDLLRFPELVWIDRHHMLPPIALAGVMALIGGAPGLVWGFAVPVLLLQHATFAINSLAHVWGRRPYATRDSSRNNVALALLTLGEGWHNNHHFFSASARQGFLWWQIDVTWWVLLGLERLGVVWDLKRPPQRVLEARRSRGSGEV